MLIEFDGHWYYVAKEYLFNGFAVKLPGNTFVKAISFRNGVASSLMKVKHPYKYVEARYHGPVKNQENKENGSGESNPGCNQSGFIDPGLVHS